MSGSILDFEESWKSPHEVSARLSDLCRQVKVSKSRIRDLESLLDRILICLNAYGSGEGTYPVTTVVQAIVRDIALHRLLEADSAAPDALWALHELNTCLRRDCYAEEETETQSESS